MKKNSYAPNVRMVKGADTPEVVRRSVQNLRSERDPEKSLIDDALADGWAIDDDQGLSADEWAKSNEGKQPAGTKQRVVN